ncbi:MAG: hypothetical protein K8T91_00690 [Planctomycetes bacterium]|nr:hypothetical protein [Planctomycetota bacterium]
MDQNDLNDGDDSISSCSADRNRLEAMLIEGLDSGESIPLNAQEWTRIRAEIATRRSHGK